MPTVSPDQENVRPQFDITDWLDALSWAQIFDLMDEGDVVFYVRPES